MVNVRVMKSITEVDVGIYSLTRAPCVGEWVYLQGQEVEVERVLHFTNTDSNDLYEVIAEVRMR